MAYKEPSVILFLFLFSSTQMEGKDRPQPLVDILILSQYLTKNSCSVISQAGEYHLLPGPGDDCVWILWLLCAFLPKDMTQVVGTCHQGMVTRECAVCALSLSRVWLLVTPWTVAHQTLQSMGFSRLELWSGFPFLLQGLNPCLLHWQVDYLPLNHLGFPKATVFAE